MAAFGANPEDRELALFNAPVDDKDFLYRVGHYRIFDINKGMSTDPLLKMFPPQANFPAGLEWKVNLWHPEETDEPKRMLIQIVRGAEFAAPLLNYAIELAVQMRNGTEMLLSWINPQDKWGRRLPLLYRVEGNVRALGNGRAVLFHLPGLEQYPTALKADGAIVFNVKIELTTPGSVHLPPPGQLPPAGQLLALPPAQGQ